MTDFDGNHCQYQHDRHFRRGQSAKETLAREAELVVWFADHTETLARRLTVGFLLAFSPLLSQLLKSLWSLDRECTLICPWPDFNRQIHSPFICLLYP
jgi:hypothetical protein